LAPAITEGYIEVELDAFHYVVWEDDGLWKWNMHGKGSEVVFSEGSSIYSTVAIHNAASTIEVMSGHVDMDVVTKQEVERVADLLIEKTKSGGIVWVDGEGGSYRAIVHDYQGIVQDFCFTYHKAKGLLTVHCDGQLVLSLMDSPGVQLSRLSDAIVGQRLEKHLEGIISHLQAL